MFYNPTTIEELESNIEELKEILQDAIDRNDSDEDIEICRADVERAKFELETFTR